VNECTLLLVQILIMYIVKSDATSPGRSSPRVDSHDKVTVAHGDDASSSLTGSHIPLLLLFLEDVGMGRVNHSLHDVLNGHSGV